MPMPGAGDGDFDDLVAIPSAMIRSRHVGTEETERADVLFEPPEGEVRCPTCARSFPSLAARCPIDDTDLTTGPVA